MAFGNCVIVNNTPENLETIGTAGFHYDGATGGPALRTVLERLIAAPALIAEYRSRASERARTTYQWGAVTDTYEALFYRLLGGRATDRSS
jgi:glycosyltransferase involved in cell wall biosynthesis